MGTLLWAVAVIVTTGAWGDDARSPARAAALTDAEKEHFLLEAQLVHREGAPGGRTRSRRVTLRLDGFEHDAHVQTIDEFKRVVRLRTGPEFDFRDSYRNNVAAYRLDRLLGLRMVPVTVLRRYDLEEAAFTWWVDDVAMDLYEQSEKKLPPPDVERWNCQVYVMRAFDQLIYNTDRNSGNLLIDKDWGVWMIDHTRAFKVFGDLRSKDELRPRCDRRFLAALKRLDEPTLETTMKDVLESGQIEGLLGRRDKIVAHYEARIAELGEEAVLCDLP
jgi:hypothetical protein